MTQHNHSIVRRSAKVLAAIAAFSIAIVTVFSFAACQKQPSSADGTPAPQSRQLRPQRQFPFSAGTQMPVSL